VEHDQPWPLLLREKLERLLAIRGAGHREALRFDDVPKALPDIQVIIDDKNGEAILHELSPLMVGDLLSFEHAPADQGLERAAGAPSYIDAGPARRVAAADAGNVTSRSLGFFMWCCVHVWHQENAELFQFGDGAYRILGQTLRC